MCLGGCLVCEDSLDLLTELKIGARCDARCVGDHLVVSVEIVRKGYIELVRLDVSDDVRYNLVDLPAGGGVKDGCGQLTEHQLSGAQNLVCVPSFGPDYVPAFGRPEWVDPLAMSGEYGNDDTSTVGREAGDRPTHAQHFIVCMRREHKHGHGPDTFRLRTRSLCFDFNTLEDFGGSVEAMHK